VVSLPTSENTRGQAGPTTGVERRHRYGPRTPIRPARRGLAAV